MTLFAAAMLFLLQTSPIVQQPQQTQSTKSTIEGFVVRAGTDEPIARARINAIRMAGPGGAPIQQSGPPPQNPAVITDSQGHFVMNDLDPGAYSLTAQRNGFARQAYGERAPGRPGTPLNILAGQVLKDVVFRLVPAGAISGRVADATGEPLAGITIQIVRSAYDSDGKRTFQPVDSARTNDRGEYRAYWITPGRYYVSASPNPPPFGGLPRFPNSNEVIEPGFVLTYFPGTTDSSTKGGQIDGIIVDKEQKPMRGSRAYRPPRESMTARICLSATRKNTNTSTGTGHYQVLHRGVTSNPFASFGIGFVLTTCDRFSDSHSASIVSMFGIHG